MGRYKKLFDILLDHAYFRNGPCKVLAVTPPRDTRRILTNADLAFHPLQNGMAISYNANFIRALNAYIAENTSLVFHIHSKDPFFYNYTDCGHTLGYVCYFEIHQTGGETSNIPLSKGRFVSRDDQMPLSDKALEGRLSRRERIAPPVGFININLFHALGGTTLDNTYKHKVYYLSFRSRETYWRYNLIKKNDVAYDELSIHDTNKQITFTPPKEVSLGNGQTARQITSTQPILLEQFPPHQFNLVGMKDNQQQVIIQKLAFPDVRHLQKEQNKEISDLYVYY